MGKTLLALFVSLLMCNFIAVSVNAADLPELKAKVKELPAVKATKEAAGVTDKHIKVEKPTNNEAKPTVNPAKAKGRQWAHGFFRIYNNTGWYMDVYEDGSYVGTISPWSFATWTAYGNTEMYCKVNFTDGSALYWDFLSNVGPGELVTASPSP